CVAVEPEATGGAAPAAVDDGHGRIEVACRRPRKPALARARQYGRRPHRPGSGSTGIARESGLRPFGRATTVGAFVHPRPDRQSATMTSLSTLAPYAHYTLSEGVIRELPGYYRGKVRENYDLPDGTRILIATDRISAFDRNLAVIPLKGQ